MKNSQSIKTQLIVFALTACSLLVVSYSILVNFFFAKGLELSVRHRLELEATSYARSFQADPRSDLPEAANFRTYLGYGDLPADIRERFAPEDMPTGGFLVAKPQDMQTGRHSFLYPWKRPDGQMLYFVYGFDNGDELSDIRGTFHSAMLLILAIGVFSVLCIVLIASQMMRRMARQIVRLTDWAFRLDKDNADAGPEDFQYLELNRLAALYQQNMQKFLAGIQREQRFLRNASHELRTPIAVVQTNMDWLRRLGADSDPRFKKPLASIAKASKNMKELVATLLWASRKETEAIARQEVRADGELQAIIDDNRYLLAGKDIEVRTDLSPLTVTIPEAMGRIIWSNIVRNAFQHTLEGTIGIRLASGTLTVTNDLLGPAAADQESYGLGLMLVRDLTDSLGWQMEIGEGERTYAVTLHMTAGEAGD